MLTNVTAATGHLGRRVVQQLLERGCPPEEITLTVRDPEKASGFAQAGCRVCQADYDDEASLAKAFEGSATVMLIPTFAMVEQRVHQHYKALQAARAAGVERIVLTGFQATSLETPFVVAPYLLYAESKLRQSGLDWTILRNGLYSDPLVCYIPELVKTGRIPYPAGDGQISYISRDDLARSAAAACLDRSHSGKTYELTGPEAISVAGLAEIVTRIAGKPVRYEPATEEEFAAMCREPGVPDYVPQALVSLYKAAARGDFSRVTNHVELLTGKPAEQLESYLNRNVQRSH